MGQNGLHLFPVVLEDVVVGRAVAPGNGFEDGLFAAFLLFGGEFYEDVFHIVWANAPVAQDSALEGAVDEEVLQGFVIAKAAFEFSGVGFDQGVGFVEHEDGGFGYGRF